MSNVLIALAHPEDAILCRAGSIACHVRFCDRVQVSIIAEGSELQKLGWTLNQIAVQLSTLSCCYVDRVGLDCNNFFCLLHYLL